MMPNDAPTRDIAADDTDDEAAELSSAVAAAGERSTHSTEAQPVEEGPRRRLLVTLAVVVASVLVWMLFRSVPAPAGSEAGRSDEASRAGTVESMANQSDPSWMQGADTLRGAPATGGPVIPPVYAPEGTPGGPVPVQRDSSGSIPGAPAAAGAEGTVSGPGGTPENPRRAAFLAALKSKPLQGGGGAGAVRGEGSPAPESPIPAPPALSEMDAAAQTEAVRRSVPESDGAAPNAPPALSAPSAAALASQAGAARASASSYVIGAAAPAPRAAGAVILTPVTAPPGTLTVPVGSVIEGQLHTAINSDLPGGVVGMVLRDVYDADQRVVVIPRYSWLFGSYESDVATGQARLVVAWTSLRFPTGETFELPALRAGDPTGASGLPANVNNHSGTIFRHALLSSIVAATFASAASSGGTEAALSRRATIADATAQQLGQTASEVTRRNLSIKPTLVVPRLTRFSILLDRNLIFPPGSPPGRTASRARL